MSNDYDRSSVSQALAAIASGCSVLTAGQGESSTGMLASWIQQCGFDPPAVTVAVKKGRPIESVIRRTGRFVLNLLGESDTALMLRHFGPGFEPGQPAFEGLVTEQTGCGVILTDTLGYLSCELAGDMDAGDHVVLIGRVVDGRRRKDGKPYVHLRKNGLSY